MQRYLATGTSKLLGTRFEITALRRDGTAFPIEISIAAVRAAGAVAFSAFIRDITERRRGEEALRHSEERFRLAAHCASDSIYEADLATGRLEWFGHDTLRFGELTPTLETWEQAIHPEDRARVMEAFDRTVKTGEPFRQAYRLPGAGGTVLHVTDRGALIRDAAGEPRLVIGVVTDVTREVHTQALEAEKASLKRSVVSMEQVLGVVAHELRTPLAGVRAMSELLLDGGARDAAEFDAFLRGMNQEVVRMAETVNNLLEAARLNSGRARWNWSTFRVGDVCREALDRVRPLVEGAAVDLSCTVSPDDLEVAGDADAVGRLLLNLLSNAVRHTPAGSVTLTARAEASEGRRWLELSVADTGAGIAPEILDRLGEPFALNAGIVGPKHVAGTGLGLAICRGIAAAHGGEMRFESKVGQGTRVTARLRADLPGPADASGRAVAATAA
jgi:signal transduction histidine kinase